MSNIARKIEKNKFKNVAKYTDEDILILTKKIDEDVKKMYMKKSERMRDVMIESIEENKKNIISTISVELLYELAYQMGAFQEQDEDIRNQIIDKVQDIYTNTIERLKKYDVYKRPQRELNKKKNLIKRYFGIDC